MQSDAICVWNVMNIYVRKHRLLASSIRKCKSADMCMGMLISAENIYHTFAPYFSVQRISVDVPAYDAQWLSVSGAQIHSDFA